MDARLFIYASNNIWFHFVLFCTAGGTRRTSSAANYVMNFDFRGSAVTFLIFGKKMRFYGKQPRALMGRKHDV